MLIMADFQGLVLRNMDKKEAKKEFEETLYCIVKNRSQLRQVKNAHF